MRKAEIKVAVKKVEVANLLALIVEMDRMRLLHGRVAIVGLVEDLDWIKFGFELG